MRQTQSFPSGKAIITPCSPIPGGSCIHTGQTSNIRAAPTPSFLPILYGEGRMHSEYIPFSQKVLHRKRRSLRGF